MSLVLEERVWAAHPLTPAYRMVLLAVARGVPEGQSEVLVVRAALGREIEATAQVIRSAFIAGEQCGLCRLLPNGRLAFTAYDALLGVDRPKPVNGTPAIREAPPQRDEIAHLTSRELMKIFTSQWQAEYGQPYYPENRDWKLAKGIAAILPAADVSRYVANYLRDQSKFYRERMHAFVSFSANINSFGGAAARTPTSRVPDADATSRYLADLRGVK